jgi:hypothetical protein
VTVPQTKGQEISTTERELTLAEFKTLCDERKGLVELHASCGGVNTCKGFSYTGGSLMEHSCRAANGCAGMSCVELPADSGLTGEQIWLGQASGTMGADGPQCKWCHSADTKQDPTIDKTAFKLAIAPGTSVDEARTRYVAKSKESLVKSIAFGIHGQRPDGTQFANMPAFYTTYSVAEINRLIDHIQSLPLQVVPWEDPQ